MQIILFSVSLILMSLLSELKGGVTKHPIENNKTITKSFASTTSLSKTTSADADDDDLSGDDDEGVDPDPNFVTLVVETVPSRHTAPLATNCYYKLDNGALVVHCIHQAMGPDYYDNETDSQASHYNQDDEETAFENLEPTVYCPAARKTYECVNGVACEVCSYQEAMAFAGLREDWFGQRYADFCSTDYPPPTTTDKPLCQLGLVKPDRTTHEPTWPPVYAVPKSHASIYVFFAVIALIAFIFFGIFFLMYHKKSEPLVLERDGSGAASGGRKAPGAGLVGKSMLLVDYTLKAPSKAGGDPKSAVSGYGSAAGQKTAGVTGASCFNTRATLNQVMESLKMPGKGKGKEEDKGVAKDKERSKKGKKATSKTDGKGSKQQEKKAGSKKDASKQKKKASKEKKGSKPSSSSVAVASSASSLKNSSKNSSALASKQTSKRSSAMGKESKQKKK